MNGFIHRWMVRIKAWRENWQLKLIALLLSFALWFYVHHL
jgi:hypothetical protein